MPETGDMLAFRDNKRDALFRKGVPLPGIKMRAHDNYGYIGKPRHLCANALEFWQGGFFRFYCGNEIYILTSAECEVCGFREKNR